MSLHQNLTTAESAKSTDGTDGSEGGESALVNLP